MGFMNYFKMAWRDLGRNKRRTALSMTAVSLGLALTILVSGFISGMIDGAMRDGVRTTTSHVQLRAADFDENKQSLLAAELIADPEAVAAQVATVPNVLGATPVLWSSGVLSGRNESTGMQIMGIQPDALFNQTLAGSIVAGQMISPDDRGELLLGQRLAEDMGLTVGDRVSLAVGTADGLPQEGIFTIKGLFNTGFPGMDNGTVYLPLNQAQAITGTGDRASAIFITAPELEDAPAIGAALEGVPGLTAVTWEQMNAGLLATMDSAMAIYSILYGIVILVVAVVITNTLLMDVFERTREMGILAALGMKNRQIMAMYLTEATILGVIGIAIGIILGSLAVWYFSQAGIYFGEDVAGAVEGMAIGSTMYTGFDVPAMISLSIATFVIILLGALYPAWYAAHLEPVDALSAL